MKNKTKKTSILKVILITSAVLLALAFIIICGAYMMFREQIAAMNTVKELTGGVYSLTYRGDYGFDKFILNGGASSDEKMADYIASFLSHGFYKQTSGESTEKDYGCSAVSAENKDGGFLFGRNYDWNNGNIMIVHTVPDTGYESISTSYLGFLGFGEDFKPDSTVNKMLSLASVYVPLDGINEKGLCIADLMAGDKEETHQNTDKTDVTTVSAIRLVLDRAATVDEAVKLLESVDMNSSVGSAHHYIISDAYGNSVVVEYTDGKMSLTVSPVLTNHYLSSGEKQGIGSEQSHMRFDIIERVMKLYGGKTDKDGIKDILRSVSQGRVGGGDEEITLWSIVYDKNALTADYYFREGYDEKFSFSIEK